MLALVDGAEMNRRVLALGRMKSGAMNGSEAEYAALLEARKVAGEIVWYRFEGITFKLADDTRYTPDFAVMMADGAMEMHEVKGFWRDDAKIKIKIAADMFPFRFVSARKVSKKAGGGWDIEEF